jgi:hypothetical protein
MGKRSEGFEKKPRDFYSTIDPEAVAFFKSQSDIFDGNYMEICAGKFDLVDLLQEAAPNLACVAAYDVEPQHPFVGKANASLLTDEQLSHADVVITNPPYTKEVLLSIMQHILPKKETWLLLPADMMHNKYMAPFLNQYGWMIISVGRLYWEPNKVKGKDNYAWYVFKPTAREETDFPVFIHRL